MCGIFGVLSNKDRLTVDQERFIKDCIVVDQLRGDDATGLLTVERDGTAEVYKQAVPGADFLYTKMGERSKRGIAMAKCVVGHNRKGTTGGAAHDSCHPFAYDKVTGVHNGTVPWAALERLDAKDTVAQVDSAKIYCALDKAREAVDVLSLIHTGSYALSWVNHEADTLNFARNAERPLWLASGEDGLYWASEPGMLVWLMSRYGLQNKESVLWELPPMQHYSIPIADPKGFTKNKYEIKGVVLARPAYQPYNNNKYQHRATGHWFANDAKAAYRTFRTLSSIKSEFPYLADVVDSIDDNCQVIRQSDPKIPSWSNTIDVVAMTYVENEVWGYLQDQAETGVCIPVKMVSVPANLKLRDKLPADIRTVKAFPTLRGEIATVKVYPSGDMVITMTPTTLWNSESDVPKGADSDEAAEEMQSVWAQDDAKLDETVLAKMWTKLATPFATALPTKGAAH